MPSLSRSVWTLCGAVGLLFVTGQAHAIPGFPGEIRWRLKLDYEPPCGLCHAKGNTGVGTVTTPFGLSIRAAGLELGAGDTLKPALVALEDDMIDSDGDGVIDVDELAEDTDPNSPSRNAYSQVGDPRWGCAVGPPASPRRPTGALLALGLLVSLVIRRRTRYRRQSTRRRGAQLAG